MNPFLTLKLPKLVSDLKCVTPLSEVFIASVFVWSNFQREGFPSKRMIRKMGKSIFGNPIPPALLSKAGFSICRPVNKAESNGEVWKSSQREKDADHQADANPAPSAGEEAEGREAASEDGEEIG